MKSIIIKIFGAVVLTGSLMSCSYLDVSDEYTGGLSDIDQVFNSVEYTRRWYGQCYDNVPVSSRMWSDAAMGNIWAFYADELYSRQANNTGKYGEWSAAKNNSSRYYPLFSSIRQCNIFLEKAKPLQEDAGSNAKTITESEMREYKANIRFLRAAYYYFLMELYGPVPIVTHSFEITDDLDIPRNSLDELIEFIDTELKEAMEEMHQEPYHNTEGFRAVPTRGTAMALRAKLWVFAASPLFNGGFTEALQLTNKDGKRLFPDKDDSKWQTAVKYCKEFIEYAEQGGRYTLYKNSGTFDPALSVYEACQEYNTEMIWANANELWGSLGAQNFEAMITPRSQPGGLGGIHVLQELVDDFYMADGYPIKETSFLPASNSYTETGFSTLDGYEVSNMYIGREPRFYNAITFTGKKWHISGDEIQLYKGGNADNRATDGQPLTGYFLYKRANRTVYGNSPGVTYKYRPSIIFRLAEFYLLYAEALNEVSPQDPDVLKYLNLVRERAGLPDIETLNPAIKGNKELQREAIRRESRIELATEGQRYFDVRRWMIAENAPGEGGQGGQFTGMNPEGNKTAFHERTYFQTRVFHRKNYLYPIPYVDIQRTENLVQNPGW